MQNKDWPEVPLWQIIRKTLELGCTVQFRRSELGGVDVLVSDQDKPGKPYQMTMNDECFLTPENVTNQIIFLTEILAADQGQELVVPDVPPPPKGNPHDTRRN